MKIFNLYENLLREEEIDQGVEACMKSFGKILFGDQLGGGEPNTKLENNYVDLIKRFTDNEYGEETSPEFKKAAINLKSCMSVYPEILVPNGWTAYRGERLPFKFFFKNYKNIDANGNFQSIYKSKSAVQSWSESEYVAESYAFGGPMKSPHRILNSPLEQALDLIKWQSYDNAAPLDKIKLLKNQLNKNNFLSSTVGVVLSHKITPDSFLFKAKYFKKLSEYPSDDEILRIGKEPIVCDARTFPMIKKLVIELNRFKTQLALTSNDFTI